MKQYDIERLKRGDEEARNCLAQWFFDEFRGLAISKIGDRDKADEVVENACLKIEKRVQRGSFEWRGYDAFHNYCRKVVITSIIDLSRSTSTQQNLIIKKIQEKPAYKLIREGMRRLCTQKQWRRWIKFEESGHTSSSKVSDEEGINRVSFQESIRYAWIRGQIGAYLLATQKSAIEEAQLLLSPEFALLGRDLGRIFVGPLSRDVIQTYDKIVSDNPPDQPTRDGLKRLWKEAERRLEEICKSPPTNPAELSCVRTSTWVMLLAARVLGSDALPLWKETWDRLKPFSSSSVHLLRQLVTLGSYCGYPSLQVDFLRESSYRDHELAQILYYVTGDTNSPIPFPTIVLGKSDHILKSVREEWLKECLEYTKYCIHNDLYKNEGLLSMVLTWPLELLRRYTNAQIANECRQLLQLLEMEAKKLSQEPVKTAAEQLRNLLLKIV